MNQEETPVKTKYTLLAVATLAALSLLLGACEPEAPDRDAAEAITEQALHEHIAELASDEYEGRFPATEGGERTEQYLRTELEEMLLQPAGDDSYFQEVPLVKMTTDPDMSLDIAGEDFDRSLEYGDEMMLWSGLQEETVTVEDSELVFVGYGAVAPEYDWNDYEDLDLEGKTVVMLVNDPGFATEDEELFNGIAMTYYGRWDYKFAEAARQGAEGAIIIHQTEPAGYGWEVVSGSWSGTQFTLDEDGNEDALAMEGWITESVAEELFEAADLDFEALQEEALSRDFEPVSMELEASTEIHAEFESATSNNVAAKIRGSQRPDEYIVYMAHWDHLGKDDSLDNPVYNGAIDNASGTAAVLETARAFSEMEIAPERSIVFLFVTAEEQGLLGSRYYAENPLYPLENTVAGINLDSLNHFGPTHDITLTGYGSSELEDHLKTVAEEVDRRVEPEPNPERGYFFRSDHFSFAREGVPALFPTPGVDHVEHGESYGQERLDEYLENDYHQPTDEYDPDWDLSGMVADTRLFFRLGKHLANSEEWPNWFEDSEFRAIRDEMRQTDAGE